MPSGKPNKLNSLAIINPTLAKQWHPTKNGSLTPRDVTPGSNKKVWWMCSEGHSYQLNVYNKIKLNQGCSYCSGKKVGYGNDLKSKYPKIAKEWDYEKNKLKPNEVMPGNHKKVWWICSNNHSFFSSINSRTNRNSSCPYCAGKKAGYGNDLKTNFPVIAKEWDYEKNKLKPNEVTPGSNKKVWWICKLNHSYEQIIFERTKKGLNCFYCSGKKVGYGNDLKSKYPKIAKEWDYEKNKLKPNEVTPGSNKKVWWICKLNHSYEQQLNNKIQLNQGCSYCSGKKVGYGNDLKSKYPDIAKEWDYEKNKLKPSEVISGSNNKFWWICSSGHSFEQRPGDRIQHRQGCPYCTLTPRSREEVFLLFELKKFFNIDENDHKIKLKRVEDIDIKLANEKVVIEYDGAYWHKDKAERDKAKTKALEKAGWIVIRVRENPLKILDKKFNVQSKPGEYKLTANSVLMKIDELGFKVNDLDSYLVRESLLNKKEADLYIKKLLKEKVKN